MRSMFLKKGNNGLPVQTDKKDHGFTIIELLLVIAIIGILAGIAVPTYIGLRTRAVHSEAWSNLEALRLLEEQRFAENGDYGADGTYTYNGSSTTLQTLLPGFQPGNAADLSSDYTLVVANTGTTFVATAVGKNTSIAAGATFSIDQDNAKVGF